MRVLITGGTSGMGQQLAMQLFAEGHDVDVIGGTDQVRGMNLVALSRGRIRYYPADLGNIGDIKRVAAEYCHECSSLDRLVLNAGVYQRQSLLDEKGVDKAFVVNYLHRFMLLLLLRPLLLASENPRVLINGCANFGGVELDSRIFGRRYQGMQGMTEALRANGLLAYWLNARGDYGVDVDAINPGYVNTGMHRQGGHLMRLMIHWFAISPQHAAEKIRQVLTASDLPSQGGYFNGVKVGRYRHSVTGRPEDFARLWEQSLSLAEIREPVWAAPADTQLRLA
ncbi:SDR family NAD(P)-dependent oxidoreductase [Aliamphritea spongicola]|uniref:SDR family NAD(P)-dependent oxidoreductase n=1 Tax=Aliamphritea spongicola TaxID=707589 RepID=UPI00196A7BA1|nr:SDR family NAD(P)-dependent oxidoreductase [Aliamphritea spongicola]MBN3564375.1 SDR family NAD(P)-dependent oxidoreductase [Aliamphritea spongicola]